MTSQPELLIAKARELGGGPDKLVAVELETFFDQNNELGSIAPNLVDHPGPQQIFEALSQVRQRPDVSSVVVLVDLEFDEYPDGEWPFGAAIQAVTSAPLAEIDAITASVGTDPAFEGVWQPGSENPAKIVEGQRIITIWWD